jgi:hypothetical protein
MAENENENVVFALSKMGISLFGNDLQQHNTQNGGGLSNLYFPGGLFVNHRTLYRMGEEESGVDPSKIEVMEDLHFDAFIDLVNVSDSKTKKSNKTKKRHLQKN